MPQRLGIVELQQDHVVVGHQRRGEELGVLDDAGIDPRILLQVSPGRPGRSSCRRARDRRWRRSARGSWPAAVGFSGGAATTPAARAIARDIVFMTVASLFAVLLAFQLSFAFLPSYETLPSPGALGLSTARHKCPVWAWDNCPWRPASRAAACRNWRRRARGRTGIPNWPRRPTSAAGRV